MTFSQADVLHREDTQSILGPVMGLWNVLSVNEQTECVYNVNSY